MRIDSNFPGNVGKIYQTIQTQAEQAEKKPAAVKNVEQDSLQLSEQAQKIHDLIKETKELPEVREEKIAKIKEAIANNTYHVTAKQLAAKMLSSGQE
jgi:negative regulator of flagellin synthesis FlgM